MVVDTKPNIPYCSFVNTRVKIGKVMKENTCTASIPLKKWLNCFKNFLKGGILAFQKLFP